MILRWRTGPEARACERGEPLGTRLAPSGQQLRCGAASGTPLVANVLGKGLPAPRAPRPAHGQGRVNPRAFTRVAKTAPAHRAATAVRSNVVNVEVAILPPAAEPGNALDRLRLSPRVDLGVRRC